MTIEKGQSWGRQIPRPPNLRAVDGDAAVVEALLDGSGHPVAAASGDLHRTLGGQALGAREELLELPIDLLTVTLDDGTERTACASVVATRPRRRGGWWVGDVVIVMNAEFLGDWHVVHRGHPNDGRAESCAWGSEFGVRQRLQARRRLPMGAHVPHPLIETRSFRQREWAFDTKMVITVDGVVVGRSASVRVEVRPDAALICA